MHFSNIVAIVIDRVNFLSVHGKCRSRMGSRVSLGLIFARLSTPIRVKIRLYFLVRRHAAFSWRIIALDCSFVRLKLLHRR